MKGRSSDFEFWEETLPIHGDFEAQSRVEDQIGALSPPFWTRAPVNFRQERSSLLPHNHPSPTCRLRAIMDGRRERMEMIKNMPESSHELSLKDIVDDQQQMEEVQEKEAVFAVENRIPQRNRKTKICRTESMGSEVFLLKMFLPVSLCSKKKAKTRSHSKHSPEGSEKPANKDWWKGIFLAIKGNQKNTSIRRSTSDISSNRTSEKKCKSREQRVCLF